MDRGQTSFDFAVGMGVFLIAVGFVLTFIPGIFAPFSVGSGGDEIVGDRVASSLSEDVLVANPGSRASLNRDCTIAFFDENSSVTHCRFNDSASLSAIVGVKHSRVNVSLRRNGEIATLNGTALTAGSVPPPDGDVTAAQRVVGIDGDLYQLLVRIW